MGVLLRSIRLGALLALPAGAPLHAQLDVISPGEPGYRFQVGPVVSFNHFPSFRGRVADQDGLRDATADVSVLGYGATLEYQPPNRRLLGGLTFTFTSQKYTQNWDAADPLTPSRTSGTVDGTFIDVYGGYRVWSAGRLRAILTGGLTWAHDELESDSEFDIGPGAMLSRSYSGLQANAGVGIDWGLTRRFRARLRGVVSTGTEQPNADTFGRVESGLMFRF